MEKLKQSTSSLKSESGQDPDAVRRKLPKLKKPPLSIRARVHFLMSSNLTHGVKVGSLLAFRGRHEDIRTTASIVRREIRDWLMEQSPHL
jgi:hypothetical protein